MPTQSSRYPQNQFSGVALRLICCTYLWVGKVETLALPHRNISLDQRHVCDKAADKVHRHHVQRLLNINNDNSGEQLICVQTCCRAHTRHRSLGTRPAVCSHGAGTKRSRLGCQRQSQCCKAEEEALAKRLHRPSGIAGRPDNNEDVLKQAGTRNTPSHDPARPVDGHGQTCMLCLQRNTTCSAQARLPF